MNPSVLLDPPILFFCLGLLAVAFKSDLEVPPNTSKFLSLYLLMAIGFKGGVSLSDTNFSWQISGLLLTAVGASAFISFYSFFLLKRFFDVKNAAAIAATYGSVSAVTFITAVSWLENRGFAVSGHLVATLALMESPAIIVGLILAGSYDQKRSKKLNLKKILHESLTNSSVFILLGSLFIGILCGKSGSKSLYPFVYDMFKGFLCFFLLDMGVSAMRKVREIKGQFGHLVLFGWLFPAINSILGMGLAVLLGLHQADAFLLIVLCASGSYIAVPAAFKMSVPDANPGIFLSMALAITFPANLLIGMPIYWKMAQFLE